MSALPPTWTPHRIEELKRLHEAGYTCSQIASEIDVTRNAVIGKISRLGLTRPPGAVTHRGRPPASHQPRTRRTQHRIFNLLRAQVPSRGEDAYVSEGPRTSLFELSPQNCRWPLGSPGADDFGFCGSEPVAGFPYCPRHARMAYQPAGRRAGYRS
jgi:GcrA cell cycle regulator